ncbi:hypothetical protein RRF57_012814 [Xylaria bambusicola]|uniref:Uncharacterized protein n=1 Tax=Xylaria bambusicola TaxID=326684 RepID=A0AAN7ZB32_9PEZI
MKGTKKKKKNKRERASPKKPSQRKRRNPNDRKSPPSNPADSPRPHPLSYPPSFPRLPLCGSLIYRLLQHLYSVRPLPEPATLGPTILVAKLPPCVSRRRQNREKTNPHPATPSRAGSTHFGEKGEIGPKSVWKEAEEGAADEKDNPPPPTAGKIGQTPCIDPQFVAMVVFTPPEARLVPVLLSCPKRRLRALLKVAYGACGAGLRLLTRGHNPLSPKSEHK